MQMCERRGAACCTQAVPPTIAHRSTREVSTFSLLMTASVNFSQPLFLCELGWWARMWSALVMVVGGHLTGKMENGGVALIIGQNEFTAGICQVKDLRKAAQKDVPLEPDARSVMAAIREVLEGE